MKKTFFVSTVLLVLVFVLFTPNYSQGLSEDERGVIQLYDQFFNNTPAKEITPELIEQTFVQYFESSQVIVSGHWKNGSWDNPRERWGTFFGKTAGRYSRGLDYIWNNPTFNHEKPAGVFVTLLEIDFIYEGENEVINHLEWLRDHYQNLRFYYLVYSHGNKNYFQVSITTKESLPYIITTKYGLRIY